LVTLIVGGVVYAQEPKTTIRVMTSLVVEKPEDKAMAILTENFEKAYQDIKIEYIGIPVTDIKTQFVTQALAGQAPDVVFTDALDLPALVLEMDLLESVDDLFGLEYLNQFSPLALDGCRVDNKLYGLPNYIGNTALFYRSDWLDESGFSTPPDTFEDFLDVAKAFTKDLDGDGRDDRWGFGILGAKSSSLPYRFYTFLFGFGGEIIEQTPEGKYIAAFNKPEGVTATQFYADLANKYKVCPPGATEADFEAVTNQFANSQVGMFISGSWTISGVLARNPDLEGKFSVCLPPKGVRRASIGGVNPWCIPRQAKNKEAAVKYIEFVCNYESQCAFTEITSRMPTNPEVNEIDYVKNNPMLKVLAEAMDYLLWRPAVPQYSQIDVIVQEFVQEALIGQRPVKDILDEAAERVNKLFE